MTQQSGSMSGKTCLVTGATAGIGEGAARELARRGAHVIVVGRDQVRCEATIHSIRTETGNLSVEFITADLSSRKEVRRLAVEFLNRHNQLHVLVNNAGAMFALRRESVDGIEMTLALNHLAPFLLTNLLIETLAASGPARVINVSSSAHNDVKGFDFDDPQARTRSRGVTYGQSELASLLYSLTMPWRHPGFVQYAQTKLANILFTLELARRLKKTSVTANTLHPGFVATGFNNGNGALGWFMRRWAGILGLTPEEGAKTIVYLACSPDVEETTGKYFVRQRPVSPSSASLDATAARRLWQLSEQWTALADDRDEDRSA